MVAAFRCEHSGTDNKTIDNSTAYISGWLRKLKDDTGLVILTEAQTQKAVELLWLIIRIDGGVVFCR